MGAGSAGETAGHDGAGGGRGADPQADPAVGRRGVQGAGGGVAAAPGAGAGGAAILEGRGVERGRGGGDAGGATRAEALRRRLASRPLPGGPFDPNSPIQVTRMSLSARDGARVLE